MATAGGILAIGGAITSAIGSYYALKSQQSQLRAQALSLEFQQFMASLDARAAEQEAQQILKAGQQQVAYAGMEAAQAKGSQAAQVGAAGIQAGTGSAAEVAASIELAKRLDAATYRQNAVQQAGAARVGATNARNQASLAGVSAGNLRRTARSISPESGALTSLIGGAGSAANYWAYNKRRNGG
jgi:hypothetical protein